MSVVVGVCRSKITFSKTPKIEYPYFYLHSLRETRYIEITVDERDVWIEAARQYRVGLEDARDQLEKTMRGMLLPGVLSWAFWRYNRRTGRAIDAYEPVYRAIEARLQQPSTPREIEYGRRKQEEWDRQRAASRPPSERRKPSSPSTTKSSGHGRHGIGSSDYGGGGYSGSHHGGTF